MWQTYDHELFATGGVHPGRTLPRVLEDRLRDILRTVDDITDPNSLIDELIEASAQAQRLQPCQAHFDNAFHEVSYGDNGSATLTISIPFTGRLDLCQHCPKTSPAVFPMGRLAPRRTVDRGDEIQFAVPVNADLCFNIQARFDAIRECLILLNADIAEYNSNLKPALREKFARHKATLTVNQAFIALTGIPPRPPVRTPLAYALDQIRPDVWEATNG